MAKIILIHGHASAVNYSFLKKHKSNLEFSAFDSLISSGDVSFFKWFIPRQFTLLEVLNPRSHIEIYRLEKKRAFEQQTLNDLSDFLNSQNPEIIICHSMGSLILFNYLKKFSLSKTVKRIILIQADISNKTKFNTIIPIYNLYCPWDPTLYLSLSINHYPHAGLFGLKHATKNIMWPLYGKANLHIASIANNKTLKLIDSFENNL